MLTAPPKAADTAPCAPAHRPAESVRTAVAINCHRRTVRIGLARDQGPAFISPYLPLSAEIILAGCTVGQRAAAQNPSEMLSEVSSAVGPGDRARNSAARWCRC